MLQWLPGSASEVLWNDREGDRFVCRILDVKTKAARTLPVPVYCVSPDAAWGVAPDFRRLNDCRPGYGYAGLPDPNRDVKAPADAGIWKVDFRTGKADLLISLAEAVKIEGLPSDADGAKHWFNHLLVSPDGSRFIFLHRWRGPKHGGGFGTRMFTAGADGKDLYVLDPHGKTSHFLWRDPTHVLAWAWNPSRGEKFYLYTDMTDRVEAVGPEKMTVNGHCSYLPGGAWILNDTYPDKERKQTLYLYRVETGERIDLGRFDSPKAYAGEWRCDLHPRCTPDGKSVIIDSPHGGDGRQMHLVDIVGVVGA